MNKEIKDRLGFMQGRLSPIVDGKIQAFPERHWQDEYPKGKEIGLSIMEWTLDFHNINTNPLLSKKGRNEILRLNDEYQLQVKTLTGDYIMQRPFHKENGSVQRELLMLMKRVIECASLIGIEILVVPLVDDGSIETAEEKEYLISGMRELHPCLIKNNIKIAFESDYNPNELLEFIRLFDTDVFGINYDIGNSAGLGYNWNDELTLYGQYIMNVHIKDREINGGTVPLGCGNADIIGVIKSLESKQYKGLYIFQAARAKNNDHEGVMKEYRNYILDNLS